MIHMNGSYDEFTDLVREYEKIYGHAATEVDPVTPTLVERQFKLNNDIDEITLFHHREA